MVLLAGIYCPEGHEYWLDVPIVDILRYILCDNFLVLTKRIGKACPHLRGYFVSHVQKLT